MLKAVRNVTDSLENVSRDGMSTSTKFLRLSVVVLAFKDSHETKRLISCAFINYSICCTCQLKLITKEILSYLRSCGMFVVTPCGLATKFVANVAQSLHTV